MSSEYHDTPEQLVLLDQAGPDNEILCLCFPTYVVVLPAYMDFLINLLERAVRF